MPPVQPSAQETPKRGAASAASTPASASTTEKKSNATASTLSSSGVARTRSVKTAGGSPMGARSAVRKATSPGRTKETSQDEENQKAETTAMIDDLKEQVNKAEAASEEYKKQVSVLQARLDEAQAEQNKLEEASQEYQERIEMLEKTNQDAVKKQNQIEHLYEEDKANAIKEKEEAYSREQELNATIAKLRDNLSHREQLKNSESEEVLSRNGSFRTRSNPNSPRHTPGSPSLERRDSSQDSAKLVLQKDKVIESLRLELAEAQIRLVEMENAGGGRVHELEQQLLQTKMSNAKLLEDNESYQMLLSEKTLNGDLSKAGLFDAQITPGETNETRNKQLGSSLADELENAPDDDREQVRKIEHELAAMKDQNKALTLYINKIITRLLDTNKFEALFDDGSITGDNPLRAENSINAPPAPVQIDKALPQLPEEEDASQEAAQPSLLQRAGSLFGGSRARPRPRSLNPPPPMVNHTAAAASKLSPIIAGPDSGGKEDQFSGQSLGIPNENPNLAPSVPLRRSHSGRGGAPPLTTRGHRRARSELPASLDMPGVQSALRSASGGTQPRASDAFPPRPSSSSSAALGSAPPLILEQNEPDEGTTTPSSNAATTDVASDSGHGGDESINSRLTSYSEQVEESRDSAMAALEGRTSQQDWNDRRHSGTISPVSQSSLSRASTAGESSTAASRRSWFPGTNAITNAMSGDSGRQQMRPLRLVQEKAEADAAQKKANRSSIMGWFAKAPTQE